LLKIIFFNEIKIENGGICFQSSNGHIYYAGRYRGTVYIANDTLPSTYQDIFIAEIDSNGNSIMANRLGCTGDKTEVTCITTHGNDIYVAGDFQGQLLGPSDTLNYIGGNTDAFIAKFGFPCTTGINEISQNSNASLLIFPNPTNNFLNISSQKISMKHVDVLNILGQTVFQKQISPDNLHNTQLNVSFLTPGVYIIQATDNNNIIRAKFIKL